MIDTAEEYQDLFDIYWVVGAVVMVVIWVAMLYLAVRYRRRPGDESPPDQVHDKKPAEVTFIGAVAVITVVLVYLTFSTMGSLAADLPAEPSGIGQTDVETAETPPAAVRIDVTGARWNWRFVYPEYGITQVGTGRTIPTLVVPRANVRFAVSSVDVIHSFYIPRLRFKRDAFPERENRFTLGFPDTGFFRAEGRCAEFCGLRHAYMDFNLQVLEPAAFRAWARARQAGAPQERTPMLNREGRYE